MDALGVEATQFTVALVGGRRFREQCLARFLEMSGLRIRIGDVENLRESLASQEEAIDLVVIDTGDHTCSDRTSRRYWRACATFCRVCPLSWCRIERIGQQFSMLCVIRFGRISRPALIRRSCPRHSGSCRGAARSYHSTC